MLVAAADAFACSISAFPIVFERGVEATVTRGVPTISADVCDLLKSGLAASAAAAAAASLAALSAASRSASASASAMAAASASSAAMRRSSCSLSAFFAMVPPGITDDLSLDENLAVSRARVASDCTLDGSPTAVSSTVLAVSETSLRTCNGRPPQGRRRVMSAK